MVAVIPASSGVSANVGQYLRVPSDAEQTHRSCPLARIVAFGSLCEMQFHIRRRAVGIRGKVQRACRAAQAAFDRLYAVCRATRSLYHKGQLSHLLPHGRRESIVPAGFDVHLLHVRE